MALETNNYIWRHQAGELTGTRRFLTTTTISHPVSLITAFEVETEAALIFVVRILVQRLKLAIGFSDCHAGTRHESRTTRTRGLDLFISEQR
ncbi:hypothetical protein CF336_g5776 [Tilletia laevis]|uniref:Uncharacterized protein n=1 Tax=Tilletia caries TaxID=13290 RepID=A0A177VC98_9BASI|nr:hypothetical protein CF336_g5776 [Tilletia laevis]KAE8195913.1 hypothetical protein CF335_g4980 [Tilletia laevis]KAE8256761.1 hypothetical protein A4X03_0g5083 [Tilletia caries]